MRDIHLKGMRGKTNVIAKLRFKYYLIFIEHQTTQIQKNYSVLCLYLLTLPLVGVCA
jgi:hypothetical protein